MTDAGRHEHVDGTPYAPHTPDETAAMLDAVGADSEADLFDVPSEVRFEGTLGIETRSERELRAELSSTFARNDDLTEFLGRDHHTHYVPSVVDDLSQRAEFLTSYTQYQPEIAQGFLQALFEYQSLVAELTGLPVANCSMYDAASGLGEAARLAGRVRSVSGERVLVPELLHGNKRAVLDNYVDGTDLEVATYPMDDGTVDVDALAGLVDEDAALVYVENPTVRGTIEERLDEIGSIADEAGRCSASAPTRWRWAFSKSPKASAPTSSSARPTPSECRPRTGWGSGCSPPVSRFSGRFRGGSSAHPKTRRAGGPTR